MQGPSMRPCKFENEAIFSKDLRPKYRLRCISGATECRERNMILVRTCVAVPALGH